MGVECLRGVLEQLHPETQRIGASADSIWAPLAWNPRCLKDFNFCHEYINTRETYEAELAMRYAGGLPAWSDPNSDKFKQKKASLGLVLRSLTKSHLELVQ